VPRIVKEKQIGGDARSADVSVQTWPGRGVACRRRCAWQPVLPMKEQDSL